jgi:putative inorganic carbon (hco3(-)) transporter
MVLPLTIGLLASILSRGSATAPADARSRVLWFGTDGANKAILTGFAVLAMTLALTLTLSRSGIVAIAAAMVFVAWMMMRRHAGGIRRVVVPIFLAATALIAFAWVGIDGVASRFVDDGAIDMEGRRAIWRDSQRMIMDFWLTGTGLNTFGTAALFYQTTLKGSHMQEAHSDYLQIVAEGGLLLAVPVAIALTIVAITIRRRLREDVGSIWWIRVGAASGLLAIAMQSLVEFSLQIPANAALFAVMCGIALHHGGRAARSRRATTESQPAFAIDDTPPNVASRPQLDLSELDVAPLPDRLRGNRVGKSRHSDRRASTPDRRTVGLISAVALILCGLIFLA